MKIKLLPSLLSLLLLSGIFLVPDSDARSTGGSRSSRSTDSPRSGSSTNRSTGSSTNRSAPSSTGTSTRRSTGSSSDRTTRSAPPIVIINNGSGGSDGYTSRDNYYSEPNATPSEPVDLTDFFAFLSFLGLIASILVGGIFLLYLLGAIAKAISELPTEMEDDKLTVLTLQVAFLSESAEAYTLRDEIEGIRAEGGNIEADIRTIKSMALLLSRKEHLLSHVYCSATSTSREKADEVIDRLVAVELQKATSHYMANESIPKKTDITDIEAAIPGYCMVVTIICALEHNKLPFSPTITTVEQLKGVLFTIQSIPTKQFWSVAPLITPTEGAGLERDEFDADYSYMVNL